MSEKLRQHNASFTDSELEQLREMAKSRKVPVSALIRSFTLDGLRNESLQREVIEHGFDNQRIESVLIKGLACASIAASLQLGAQLLDRNSGESEEAFAARKKAFVDSSLQNAFRLGNQVFDIHESSRKAK